MKNKSFGPVFICIVLREAVDGANLCQFVNIWEQYEVGRLAAAANNFSQYLICSWSQNVARVRQYRYLNISRIVEHFTNILKKKQSQSLAYDTCQYFANILEYENIYKFDQFYISFYPSKCSNLPSQKKYNKK